MNREVRQGAYICMLLLKNCNMESRLQRTSLLPSCHKGRNNSALLWLQTTFIRARVGTRHL